MKTTEDLLTDLMTLVESFGRAQRRWASGTGSSADIAAVRSTLESRLRDVVEDALDAARTQAARDVLAERRRQVEEEGWTPEHDDEHSTGDMAAAAASYALAAGADSVRTVVERHERIRAALHVWPWASEWWKPKDGRRNLVKAGALILAEIERLDRASMKETP
jgi:hypothetical protein